MMRAYYDPDATVAPPNGGVSPKIVAEPARRAQQRAIRRQQTRQAVRRLLITIVLMATLPLAAGCVYQAALSQGNLLKQADLDQVKVGMTRNQVRFLLGTPMIDDPFHEERWDYVYYLKVGREKATFKRWVSIYFDGDTVREIVDDQELEPDL
jgi:outer membrane protein assembly factor BamE